jgi:Na+/proline symporter
MEDYFVAGRSLRWWAIGFANCATYTGGSAAWVMLVFQDGLAGNFWWWPSWVVWMPLVAVLWARYWRRMGIVTTAEFIELRYGGKASRIYRVIYALYSCLGWAPIATGYMTGWIVVELGPILGWSRVEITLACGALVLVYTVVSGLFGVVYNQIFQFCFYLAGASLLLPAMIRSLGGWHGTLNAAVALRGPGFLHPLPPSPSLTPEVLLALFLMGFFFAANPMAGEGSTAQRFMAAKDETHAALGQMFSALLALVVRVIPFIIFGIVAAALYPKGSIAPELIWSRLVMKFAPTGLLGVVIAAELAGYMAIANGFMNWGASFLANDIYRGAIHPRATERQLAVASKVATVIIICLSFLVSILLVDRMMSWFLYINAVMIAFVLPLAWLRFFWWRLNIWGEAAGVVLGLPLGYLIWFPLGFSQRPFWQAFFVLFVAGWVLILAVTLFTPAESREQLRKFYEKCRPPGLWGPVAEEFPTEARRRIHREFRGDLVSCFIGIVLCAGMVVTLNAVVAGAWLLALVAATCALASGLLFIHRWKTRNRTSESDLSPQQVNR